MVVLRYHNKMAVLRGCYKRRFWHGGDASNVHNKKKEKAAKRDKKVWCSAQKV